jgi:hypothetical protein
MKGYLPSRAVRCSGYAAVAALIIVGGVVLVSAAGGRRWRARPVLRGRSASCGHDSAEQHQSTEVTAESYTHDSSVTVE